jgi:hypothetical protein
VEQIVVEACIEMSGPTKSSVTDHHSLILFFSFRDGVQSTGYGPTEKLKGRKRKCMNISTTSKKTESAETKA